MTLVQEMVQEKATALLEQPNLALLMLHLQQYRERRLSVQKLVQLLMSMFDTQVGFLTTNNSALACHRIFHCRPRKASSRRLMS